MATAGRPPKKLGHIDGLTGSEQDKRRLRVVLETVVGERSVRSACRALGVSEARFHVLRQQALQGAIEGLAPGRPGRPRHEEPEEAHRVRELEEHVQDLEVDLQAARVRTEIALTMPHLLRRKKKEPEAKARRRRKRR